MPLSWNEIKDRALRFSREWQHESSEDAEAKSFWDGFFNVFGVSRRRVANFEKKVKKLDGKDGYIDLLWKGVLLIEHKSRGKDLDRAHTQARDYFHGLTDAELPRYLLVCDFERFRLYDLESDESPTEFALKDLQKHVRQFGFIAGYQARSFKEEDPVNVLAAERMGRLHDALKAAGYDGHALEVLLVRLLFCLFGDDTGIFPRHAFHELLAQRTSVDGADIGQWLAQLFQVLDTAPERRQKTLDAQLAEFPYVNGKLFAEPLPLAAFDAAMREQLLQASALDWSRISPAIFGSMFQSVMDAKARRNLGAHYTSERNILKLIGPLFLDELKAELARIGNHENKLKAFHVKLASLRFLDPACGCGNFLVIAYRELRALEIEVLQRLYARQGSVFHGVADHVAVDVDQFYGIEIEEFPAQIAQVALWLMDHQMNLRVAEQFGEYFARLPLTKAPTIVNGNALRIDWKDVVAPEQLSCILGNPPFIGAKLMTADQRDAMQDVAGKLKGAGLLDFVSAWYLKAANYVGDRSIRVAFVSTNSITQGEQVGVLWGELLAHGFHIQFAHRTFRWNNEARGVAAVHCVIVGFGHVETKPRRLFDYEHPKADPHEVAAANINPYLVDAPDALLPNRSSPLCAVPSIGIGNKPIDGGSYLFTTAERDAFIAAEPASTAWFRRWLGSDEFINGWERWCLWLGDCPPETLRKMPLVLERVEAVRAFRRVSKSAPTQKLANTPTRFHVENSPQADYLVIPKVSSERRAFIPIGFMAPDTMCSDLLFLAPHVTHFHFGVITSTMHMAWVRAVCGRLESRYRYSAGIVYNNFPWPELEPLSHRERGRGEGSGEARRRGDTEPSSPTLLPEGDGSKRKAAIETAAQAVLDARAAFPDSTLADLYDPLSMPPALVKAHQALDRAVDAAYAAAEKAAGRKPPKLGSDAERVAFLFERYQHLTSLLPVTKPKATRRRTTTRTPE
ncbi:DNA methyltransferase [Rhodanobacter lindaniclasticus]